jgi:hypothetical protein
MYKTLLIMSFFFLLILPPGLNRISYAQSKQSRVTLMQEHMDRMKNKSPEKYQRMVDNAKSGVSDCISCHVKKEDKKRHFRFVNPYDPVTPGK